MIKSRVWLSLGLAWVEKNSWELRRLKNWETRMLEGISTSREERLGWKRRL